MRRVILWVGAAGLFAALPAFSATHHASRAAAESPVSPPVEAGGLSFTLPAKWIAEKITYPARVGQWRVPPPHGQTGESGQVVVFYFGHGVGGSARTNLDAWTATMSHPERAPEIKNDAAGGLKISEVVIYGTYNEAVPIAGLPPLAKPNEGLVGVVIEGPQGNIYWRFTGPEALVAADLPLFEKMIDGLKPQDKG